MSERFFVSYVEKLEDEPLRSVITYFFAPRIEFQDRVMPDELFVILAVGATNVVTDLPCDHAPYAVPLLAV